MNTPAAQQRIPPKLRQLLESMPDVDKVKLMQIAHHYSMDLDDPGFLPLLLTQQGISALEKAKAEMVLEVDASLNLVASKITSASRDETARLKEFSEQLAGYLQKQAADADASMKRALEAWACGPLAGAVFDACAEQIEATAAAATAGAQAEAAAAAAKFSDAVGTAASQAREAGAAATAAAVAASGALAQIGTAWVVAVFFAGSLSGALGLELIKRVF